MHVNLSLPVSTMLLAPLVTVAALAPVVACKYGCFYAMSDRERALSAVSGASEKQKGTTMSGAV